MNKYTFFLKSIFIISLFILLFISSISYKHASSLETSADLLAHSYKIQIQLHQLQSYVKDAETGQRGYIITRDSAFLSPYFNSRSKINKSFASLNNLTINQPELQKNIEQLRKLIDLRFILLLNSLEIMTGSKTDQSLDENMLKGTELMNDIQLKIDQLVYLEKTIFNEHQKKYDHDITFTPLITLISLTFTLIMFILSFIKINKDLIKLMNSNEELLISTESIKHAEIIGEFCISIWNINTNKLIYSDNLYRLLGCEPNSFKPSVKNYLKFVHPDDRHIVANGVDKLLKKHDTYTRLYRVIRQDGQVRFFRSIGKFIENHGQSTHIGVIQDITPEHINNSTLQEKNRELELSNQELSSFNQIASHDLQEPLRKIQTFISLIKESELSGMSKSDIEYFDRIQNSVTRMRKLIDDLLLFSRTNKTDKIFEESDLNVLLKNTLLELSEEIEEKGAHIESAQLPVLKVIPFQIQQLFKNLINNSLKYSKISGEQMIKIGCEKIVAKDYPILNMESEKKYYKITVADSGQGFEQQYAEQIFTIFKRLHTSDEYPGTGIGLSICKRIVENHSGFIFAEGKSGIGATFSIFFPAE